MFVRSLCSPPERAEWLLQRSLAASLGFRARSRPHSIFGLCTSVVALAVGAAIAAESVYPLEVLPPEHRRMTDPKTGAELLFLTTAPATMRTFTSMSTPGWRTSQ